MVECASRRGSIRREGRRLLVIAVALAAVAGASGCAAKERPASNAGAPTGGDIPIGVDIELSGPAAVQGVAYRNAVELVAEQLNRQAPPGGRKIRLIIRDNKSDPTQALQIAKEMIDRDRVVGIVGGGSTPTTLSLVDAVERAGVPTVSMGSSGAIVTPLDKRRYLFKTPANTDQVVQVMLADMRARGIRRVGFISVDNPYGDAGLKAFDAAAAAGKITITGHEKFQPTDKDFTTQVTKLAATSPDAIVTWAIPPGAGIVAKNAAAVGYRGKLYFDAGAGAELFIQGAGSAAEGVYMVHPTVLAAPEVANAPNKQQMTSFYDSYTARYGAYSGFASYGADALHLLAAAISAAGTTDRAKVRDALERLTYTGITGVYHMTSQDHTGLSASSLSLLTVHGGKWTLVADSAVNKGVR